MRAQVIPISPITPGSAHLLKAPVQTTQVSSNTKFNHSHFKVFPLFFGLTHNFLQCLLAMNPKPKPNRPLHVKSMIKWLTSLCQQIDFTISFYLRAAGNNVSHPDLSQEPGEQSTGSVKPKTFWDMCVCARICDQGGADGDELNLYLVFCASCLHLANVGSPVKNINKQ